MTLITAPNKGGCPRESSVLFNQLMTEPVVSDYRLSPRVVARIVGSGLVAVAVLMFVSTALVAATGWPADLLVVVLAAGVVGVFGLAGWLRARAYVVRFEADGYRVGLVRGAGVRHARWADVTDVVAASPRGVPCLELRLRDGGSTVLPLAALATDPDDFLRELKARLQGGHGLRPL